MKFEWSEGFADDRARLADGEQALFERVVRTKFLPACDRFRLEPSTPWPHGLRVKRVQGAPEIWEMTWSFAEPHGRATFEWIAIDGELSVRWRRMGGHATFGRP